MVFSYQNWRDETSEETEFFFSTIIGKMRQLAQETDSYNELHNSGHNHVSPTVGGVLQLIHACLVEGNNESSAFNNKNQEKCCLKY